MSNFPQITFNIRPNTPRSIVKQLEKFIGFYNKNFPVYDDFLKGQSKGSVPFSPTKFPFTALSH
jgi:hypothetical protein